MLIYLTYCVLLRAPKFWSSQENFASFDWSQLWREAQPLSCNSRILVHHTSKLHLYRLWCFLMQKNMDINKLKLVTKIINHHILLLRPFLFWGIRISRVQTMTLFFSKFKDYYSLEVDLNSLCWFISMRYWYLAKEGITIPQKQTKKITEFLFKGW